MRDGAHPAASRLAICTPEEAASRRVVCRVVKPMPCVAPKWSERSSATKRQALPTLMMIVEKLDTMLHGTGERRHSAASLAGCGSPVRDLGGDGRNEEQPRLRIRERLLDLRTTFVRTLPGRIQTDSRSPGTS